MDRFERLSKIAQDEFGVTIKSKSPTGETFESLYCKTKDSDRREKQIEAIAKAMCGGCPDNKECMHSLCADWYKAESIYNADYRKQSEVAKEIFEKIDKIISKEMHRYEAMRAKSEDFKEMKFWEGGKYSLQQISYWYAELKKKYAGESGNDR